MLNRTALVFILSAMLIVTAGCGTKLNNAGQENQGTPTETVDNSSGGAADENEPKSWPEMPAMSIDKEKTYSAVFKTNKGEFTVDLFAKDAPQTVNSFVFLSKEKFYDGIKFHRIIKDFMIQGGDPLGNGTGGPGYTIPDEFNNGHKFEAGIIAMANTGRPGSGGSQFFICTGAGADFLNQQPNYTIFGKVSSGMDVVTAIASTPVGPGNGEPTDSKPLEDVTIESISISEK
ncbi:peptidylprolyl isomerase [Paenibacillus montanisoli]|uniref:Peptidyl-prolyl cis-trans isomerase n=1 Tax=Paenibacillus montanisoli TaxID=2081970 RepID=A0A328U8N4_9BACL|nr:peptidylprolyl isomerase [Paenibacillus montanisoli]RAP78203.1 peptidylprolyl isomerase [Paenibacillus montanisoli]